MSWLHWRRRGCRGRRGHRCAGRGEHLLKRRYEGAGGVGEELETYVQNVRVNDLMQKECLK